MVGKGEFGSVWVQANRERSLFGACLSGAWKQVSIRTGLTSAAVFRLTF